MIITEFMGRALISPRLASLPDRLFRVLIGLVVHADPYGVLTVTQLELQRRLGISVWELQSAIKSLQEGGYVTYEDAVLRVVFDFVQATPETATAYGLPEQGVTREALDIRKLARKAALAIKK